MYIVVSVDRLRPEVLEVLIVPNRPHLQRVSLRVGCYTKLAGRMRQILP